VIHNAVTKADKRCAENLHALHYIPIWSASTSAPVWLDTAAVCECLSLLLSLWFLTLRAVAYGLDLIKCPSDYHCRPSGSRCPTASAFAWVTVGPSIRCRMSMSSESLL